MMKSSRKARPTSLDTRPLMVSIWLDSRTILGVTLADFNFWRIRLRRKDPLLEHDQVGVRHILNMDEVLFTSSWCSGTQAAIWLVDIFSSCRLGEGIRDDNDTEV